MAGLRDALRVIMEASAPRAGETNAVRMFAGPMARTADQEALSRAQQLAQSGAPREQIWNDTGWFQGVDGKWRFEIDDSGSAFNVDAMAPVNYGVGNRQITALTGQLETTMPHQELYQAYPQLGGVTTVQGRGANFHGQFSGKFGGQIEPSMSINLDSVETAAARRSTALHETQHAIQDLEGYARGGNTDYIAAARNPEFDTFQRAISQGDARLQEYTKIHTSPDYARELQESNALWLKEYAPRLDALEEMQTRANRAELRPKIQALFEEYKAISRERFPTMSRSDDLADELRGAGIPRRAPSELLSKEQTYYRLGGEVEARNVQNRRDYTPEQRRASPPWTTQDVPDDQQIVRFGDDGPSNALGDVLRVSAGLGSLGLAGDITLRQLLRDNMATNT